MPSRPGAVGRGLGVGLGDGRGLGVGLLGLLGVFAILVLPVDAVIWRRACLQVNAPGPASRIPETRTQFVHGARSKRSRA